MRNRPAVLFTRSTSTRSSMPTAWPVTAKAKSRAVCAWIPMKRLMKGGKDGPVIVAGQPDKSLLLERVTLPPDHKHFMPAEGKPPLQAGRDCAGSGRGFSRELRLRPRHWQESDSRGSPGIAAAARWVTTARSWLKSGRWQQARVQSWCRCPAQPSDGLILEYSRCGQQTLETRKLAQFSKFAPYIVEAELGRTAVTDASFAIAEQVYSSACAPS